MSDVFPPAEAGKSLTAEEAIAAQLTRLPRRRRWHYWRWTEVRIADRRDASAAARDKFDARRLIAADPAANHPGALVHALAVLAHDYSRTMKHGRRRDPGQVIAHALDNAEDGAGIPPARCTYPLPAPPAPVLTEAEAMAAGARIVAVTHHLRPEAAEAAVAERIGIVAAQTVSCEMGRCRAVAALLNRAHHLATTRGRR